ncbi:IS4 family transposase [Streptomyces mirabilis]|uniref:IS4 family transposase n=1 Tax=Streptomyces mirabilis TaxID=68239 RepID=UPI0039A41E5E
MSVQSAISSAALALAPGRLGELTEHVPAALVDEVLEVTRRKERRIRLLPARVVVYFVLAMALFPGDGYQGVWAHLVAGLDRSAARFPSSKALRLARVRLGAAPLAELFRRVCGTVADTETTGAWWRGLRVVAWDGTGLEVADSAANAAFFGYPSGSCGPAGYPQLRMVAIVECGTRALIDAVWGPQGCGENALAARLVASLRRGMLLLADRGFDGYELWGHTTASGASLLWRAKGKRLLPRLKELPDGSYLSLLPERRDMQRRLQARRRGKTWDAAPIGHPVRVVEYAVAVTTSDGDSRTEHFRLITTLLDPGFYPAAELAELYHQRWEIETAYFSFKISLRGAGKILRSHTPDGVDQELYGYLIVYQALRRSMHQVALALKTGSVRLSFNVALREARDSVIQTHPSSDEATRDRIHSALTREIRPARRRDRCSPRTVKRPSSPFPSNRRRPSADGRSRTSLKVSYRILIPSATAPLTIAPDP